MLYFPSQAPYKILTHSPFNNTLQFLQGTIDKKGRVTWEHSTPLTHHKPVLFANIDVQSLRLDCIFNYNIIVSAVIAICGAKTRSAVVRALTSFLFVRLQANEIRCHLNIMLLSISSHDSLILMKAANTEMTKALEVSKVAHSFNTKQLLLSVRTINLDPFN